MTSRATRSIMHVTMSATHALDTRRETHDTMAARHPSHLPRDTFMDEEVEGAPLKEKKKKRPRKKKQIAQSLPVVSRGRFRHKESPRMRKQMRKQICRMKRLNQWPPTEAELGVVQNGSTAAIMHGRFRQIYDDEVRAKRKYDSGASATRGPRVQTAEPPL